MKTPLAFTLGEYSEKDISMAKGQMKSSRETRKPKAEKPPKGNASNPSTKPGVVAGLDNLKNR